MSVVAVKIEEILCCICLSYLAKLLLLRWSAIIWSLLGWVILLHY